MFKHTLVRCKYIYNYVNIKLLLYFFVFYDSRLRVFQFAPTDADVRTDRRRHPHRPTHAIRGATLHAHSITAHPQQ